VLITISEALHWVAPPTVECHWSKVILSIKCFDWLWTSDWTHKFVISKAFM